MSEQAVFAPVASDAPNLGSDPVVRPSSARRGAPRGAWYPAAPALQGSAPTRISRRIHGERVHVEIRSDGSPVARTSAGRPWGARSLLGLIWVCAEPDVAPTPGLLDDEGLTADDLAGCSQVVCRADYDQTVLGLVDPAHVPMIHQSWWWRSPKRRRAKTKRYEPSEFGFTATALDPFVSAAVYRLLGRQVRVSIEFRLPSVRAERIVGERGRVLNLTTVTPVGPRAIVLRNRIYTNLPELRALRAPVSWLGRRFLGQDVQMLRRLDPEAAASPRQLFVGDPDRPSLWYFASKTALHRAQTSGRIYENPVAPTELTWFT